MSCSGHCLDITPHEVATVTPPNDTHRWPCLSDASPARSYVYTPLKRGQTRILRLHPAQPREGSEQSDEQLYADMLVVNLLSIEGVSVVGSEDIIGYQALSYSWGHPDLDDVLICNQASRLISSSNAAALKALRHPESTVHLWIDAICINQEDKQEKSEQVAMMMLIFQKAQSVTAWLGEPDNDSVLAFSCMSEPDVLEQQLSVVSMATHRRACFDKMRAMYIALLCLYNRPWLRRTWVRQEIYAARHLVVQCGSYKVPWKDFIRASDFMLALRSVLPDHLDTWHDQEIQVARLLAEARINADAPPHGVKPPRNLIEVLLQSAQFEVTDQNDTFYAVMGMCKVRAAARSDVEGTQGSENTVLVDYTNSLSEVLRDASLYVIGREADPAALAGLWHSYRRTPAHSADLPSWVVDWRSGTSDDGHRAVQNHSMRTHPAESRTRIWGISVRLQVPLARHWIPLWSPSRDERRLQRTYRDGAMQLNRIWHWPSPLHSNRSVLCVYARTLNYIAYLTDFTCVLDHFLNENCHKSLIGFEGLSIHARTIPRRHMTFFDLTWAKCTHLKKFEPRTHAWRLAILGVGNDSQLALVPPTAEKGDIVVAIAPGTLPMIVRPCRSDGTIAGLLPQDDPYEDLPHDDRYAWYETAVKSISYLFIAALPAFSFLLSWPSNNMDFDIGFPISYGVMVPLGLVFGLLKSHFSLRRVYTRHLRFLRFVMLWEWIMIPMSVIIYPFCIARTTGYLRTIFIVYFCLTLVGVLSGCLWRNHRLLGDQLIIALRREKVLTHLDKVTQKLGRDFEFHGPLYVKMDREQWYLPRWMKAQFIRWCLFHMIKVANNCTRGQPRLDIWRFEWFFKEVLTPRGDYPDSYPWNNDEIHAWNRPVQEIRLH